VQKKNHLSKVVQ